MSIFRPSNTNKRLVGTATTIGGSPGNGGQIGPKKTPYLGGPTVDLGERFQFGCCKGVFKTNESQCGRKEDCQCNAVDCGGFLICKAAPVRWIVAPSSAQVNRVWDSRNDANTRAQEVSGCTGWFIPTYQQLQNPGYCCRSFWDSFSPSRYWANQGQGGSQLSSTISFEPGGAGAMTYRQACFYNFPIRSFRCVTY